MTHRDPGAVENPSISRLEMQAVYDIINYLTSIKGGGAMIGRRRNGSIILQVAALFLAGILVTGMLTYFASRTW